MTLCNPVAARLSTLDWLLGRRVDVLKERTFKFYPHNPPRRGDVVVVDGVRCRVTRSKVSFDDPQEERRWTLHSLRVKEAPLG